jgi:hypothetical protein
MRRIDNENMKKPAFFLVTLCLAQIAGCASSGYSDAEYNMDAREELRQMPCPSDTTAACIERIGKPTQCFCGHRDDIERILEPKK